MGMFDWYVPQPPIACPRCGVLIKEWQGKSGPNALFEWVQGRPAPVGQRVDDECAMAEQPRDLERLPETFELHQACDACGGWVIAEGACQGGVWTTVNLVDPLEAPGLPRGWATLDWEDREHLTEELRRELAPGHVLKHARLTPLAHRRSRDDFLVRAGGAPAPLYMVHLTWHAETDPRWPTARPYQSVAEFAAAEAEEED